MSPFESAIRQVWLHAVFTNTSHADAGCQTTREESAMLISSNQSIVKAPESQTSAAAAAAAAPGDVIQLKKAPGGTFSVDELKAAVAQHKPAILFLVQV